MRRQAISTAWAISLFAGLSAGPCSGRRPGLGGRKPVPVLQADQSFALHEAAFNAVRGDPDAPLPADIDLAHRAPPQRSRLQGLLAPGHCAATAGKRYEQSRLGWAAQTLDATCYESNGRPRRYSAVCERKYSWGTREGRLRPARGAHRQRSAVAPEQLAGVDRRLRLDAGSRAGRRQGRDAQARLQGQAHHRARAVLARSRRSPACRSRSSCRTAASSPTPMSWSRTCSSSRSAIPSRPAKAIPTGRCTFSAVARDGLRPDARARGRGRATRRQAAAGFGLASADDQSIRRCCRAA